jgi:hypothetical protein
MSYKGCVSMCRMQSKSVISAALLMAAHAAVLCWNAAAPDAAHASCVAPDPKVIWSYPAAGQAAVPLDSDLLMLTEGIWDDAQVTLDGEPLSAGSQFVGHFDLGALEPNTTYTVAIKSSGENSPPVDLSWQFTTGDAASDDDVPLAVTIQSAASVVYEFDDEVTCSPALLANSCFDTGYPTLESFETDVEAVLWVVELFDPNFPDANYRLYPGECGQPRMLDYPGFNASGQYRVHAILRDGSIVTSEPVMVPFGTPDDDPMDPAPPADDEPAGGAAGSQARPPEPAEPQDDAQDHEPAPSGQGSPSFGDGEDAPAASGRSCAVSAVGHGRGGFALALIAAAAWLSTRRRFAAARAR